MTQIASRMAVLSALITLFIAACGGEEDGPAASPTRGFPLTVTQSDGQELTLTTAPQCIVSLSTHATEMEQPQSLDRGPPGTLDRLRTV